MAYKLYVFRFQVIIEIAIFYDIQEIILVISCFFSCNFNLDMSPSICASVDTIFCFQRVYVSRIYSRLKGFIGSCHGWRAVESLAKWNNNHKFERASCYTRKLTFDILICGKSAYASGRKVRCCISVSVCRIWQNLYQIYFALTFKSSCYFISRL